MKTKKQTKERRPPLKSPRTLRSTRSNSGATTTTTTKVMKTKKAKGKQPEVHENVTRRRRNFKVPKTRDLDEMRRLMNRIPPPLESDRSHTCAVCYSDDHYTYECPCREKIPPNVSFLGPTFDSVCIGCGTIGKDCCSQGTYALRKCCGGCMEEGHWYWEKRCDKGRCFPPYVVRLPFTEYEEVPCPYDCFKNDGNWWRMVDSQSDEEAACNEKANGKEQPRNIQKKIVRAVKKRAV